MEWIQLPENDLSGKKWELRVNDVVLGTIYGKPRSGKYSLYFANPIIVKKFHHMFADSYEFDTFEEAQAKFKELLSRKAVAWARAVLDFCRV
jgi:hypothetical protein